MAGIEIDRAAERVEAARFRRIETARSAGLGLEVITRGEVEAEARALARVVVPELSFASCTS